MVLILLASFASALEINAPSEVSDASLLYFNVALDAADDFDEAEVSLDGDLMVTVYANQLVVPNSNSVLDAYVVDTNPSQATGLKLYVIVYGLEKGSYTLEAESFEGNDTVETDSQTVVVFEAIGKEFKEETNTQLNELSS
jgi:hypothetical protein